MRPIFDEKTKSSEQQQWKQHQHGKRINQQINMKLIQPVGGIAVIQEAAAQKRNDKPTPNPIRQQIRGRLFSKFKERSKIPEDIETVDYLIKVAKKNLTFSSSYPSSASIADVTDLLPIGGVENKVSRMFHEMVLLENQNKSVRTDLGCHSAASNSSCYGNCQKMFCHLQRRAK